MPTRSSIDRAYYVPGTGTGLYVRYWREQNLTAVELRDGCAGYSYTGMVYLVCTIDINTQGLHVVLPQVETTGIYCTSKYYIIHVSVGCIY